MDRGRVGDDGERPGLPRVRGDGPHGRHVARRVHVAPPRARGWTRHGRLAAASARGSPACAGMDPRLRNRLSGMPGLPRVRGDGPGQWCAFVTSEQAPPRARGWTRPPRAAGPRSGGSPACAGMDPLPSCSCASATRLPRVRGDGPGDVLTWNTGNAAPPRARGWTLDAHRPAVAPCGSPACAGMDPRPMRRVTVVRGLPRVRGDGPPAATTPRRHRGAPPRARGWTRGARGRRCRHGGSPACAGMDP